MTTTTRTRVCAAAGALGLAAGLAVAAPATASAAALPSATTTTAGCSTGSVPAPMQGRPTTLRAGLPLGYWVWHDSSGWHVAATHATKHKVVLTGVVRTSNPMHATGVKLEHGLHGDRWVLSPNHRALTFRFTNYGGLDALRIGADCSATVSFALYADGRTVAPAQIHLGSAAVAATTNPVVVRRVPVV